MAVKFFGQFLVERGLVSSSAVLEAIALQEKNNLKLGEMAVAMGLITKQDIERAHNAQRSKDLKLGDMLVNMGILTNDQLNQVIARQKSTHLYIGEALVQVGALSKDSLARCLDEFKADQAEYVAEQIELPACLSKSPELWVTAVDLTHKMITRVLGLQFRPGKCATATHISTNHVIAAMDFTGDLSARYMLSVSANLQKVIAKVVLQEESVDKEPVEVLDDTVMEFVNIVCGNIVAKASQTGMQLDINPPSIYHPQPNGISLQEGQIAAIFPIHIGENDRMDLILLIKTS
jgi:CheY-specific phosphatase CheX